MRHLTNNRRLQAGLHKTVTISPGLAILDLLFKMENQNEYINFGSLHDEVLEFKNGEH